jgi:lipoprotein NlpI
LRTLTIVAAITAASSALAQWTEDAERCSTETSPDLALHYCSRAIDSGRLSDANLAIAFNNRGVAYDDKGQYDRAIQDYDQAIWLRLDYAEAFNNRGNAYGGKGQYDRAIQDYDHAIRLKPDYAEAFNNRGNAYGGKGQYDRAIQDYDHAIRLKPDYAEAFYNRGNAWRKRGQYDRAIQDYDQAIGLKPDYAKAFNNRGVAHDDKRQYDRAIQDYDQAIRLKPDYAEAFYNRGNAWRKRGQYDRAIQDYDQAIRLKPDYAEAFYNRGQARFNQGHFSDAVPDFDNVAQFSRSNPYRAIWLYLAQARAGRNGSKELENNATRLEMRKWPGPVVDLYLGKLTLEAVLAAASNRDEKTQQEQLCGAYFYSGEYLMIAQRRDEARPYFEKAVATCPRTFHEYEGARAELDRMR